MLFLLPRFSDFFFPGWLLWSFFRAPRWLFAWLLGGEQKVCIIKEGRKERQFERKREDGMGWHHKVHKSYTTGIVYMYLSFPEYNLHLYNSTSVLSRMPS